EVVLACRVGGSTAGPDAEGLVGDRGFRLAVRQRALERTLAWRRLHHLGLQIEIENTHPAEREVSDTATCRGDVDVELVYNQAGAGRERERGRAGDDER